MTLSGLTVLIKSSLHQFPAGVVCQSAVRLYVITWKLLFFFTFEFY